MARPIAQAISLEKFRGADRSVKTIKLFHLERFAIYGTPKRVDYFRELLEMIYFIWIMADCYFALKHQ